MLLSLHQKVDIFILAFLKDNKSKIENENIITSFLLIVRDTGIGISKEKIPFIFDRFYQVDDSSTRHGEGTGIGLVLVKELVKLMDGDIIVKSALSKGTEFIINLPINLDKETISDAIIFSHPNNTLDSNSTVVSTNGNGLKSEPKTKLNKLSTFVENDQNTKLENINH